MTPDHGSRHADLAADANFKAWLYRPFLNLGPAEATGNHYLPGLTFAYKAMAERKPYPRVHGVLLPSARQAMVREARLPAFDVDDPLDLDETLRTPAWSELCRCLLRCRVWKPKTRCECCGCCTACAFIPQY